MLHFTPKQLFSIFSRIKEVPPDPILGIGVAFNKCTDPKKVNLGIGAYRDNNGKPIVMKAVQEAVSRMAARNMDNEYLPPQGHGEFLMHAQRLALGEDLVKKLNIATVQSISGSGGIRIAFELLHNEFPEWHMYFPIPTWGNHEAVAHRINLPVKGYRYYDKNNMGLDIKGALEDFEKLPEKQLVLFQASGFNPVGVDPTKEEWKMFRDVIEKKGHAACFDMAYQGFVSGDLAQDAWGLRYFAEKPNIPLIFIQSFSKNFGLYCQRAGCVSIVCSNEKEKNAIVSSWNVIAREQYSMAPAHGVRVVAEIMNCPKLRKLWADELKQMAERINDMRTLFRDTLVKCGSKRNWDHIVKQRGMFAFTGVNEEQAKRLRNEFHVFLTDNGRISVAGLNRNNCEYAAKCFHEVTK